MHWTRGAFALNSVRKLVTMRSLSTGRERTEHIKISDVHSSLRQHYLVQVLGYFSAHAGHPCHTPIIITGPTKSSQISSNRSHPSIEPNNLSGERRATPAVQEQKIRHNWMDYNGFDRWTRQDPNLWPKIDILLIFVMPKK